MCNVGCSFAGMLINHLMYADDLVLLVPSVASLDKLLRLCEKLSKRKSAVMIFRSKLLKAELTSILALVSGASW